MNIYEGFLLVFWGGFTLQEADFLQKDHKSRCFVSPLLTKYLQIRIVCALFSLSQPNVPGSCLLQYMTSPMFLFLEVS